MIRFDLLGLKMTTQTAISFVIDAPISIKEA